MDKTYLNELAQSFRWFENDYLNAMKDVRENVINTLKTIIDEQNGEPIEIPTFNWTMFDDSGEVFMATITDIHKDGDKLLIGDWGGQFYDLADQDVALITTLMDEVFRTYGAE